MKSIKQYWDDWIQKIKESNDQKYIEEINGLKQINSELKANLSNLDRFYQKVVNLNDSLEEENSELNEIVTQLNEDLNNLNQEKEEENAAEEYWNNKRKKTNLKYKARPAFNKNKRINVDPRIFFMNSPSLPKVSGKTNDEKANNALKYVRNNITYTEDTSQFKQNEVWLFPFETLKLKKGDCFAGYEELYTKEGLKRIDELSDKDTVLSYDFKLKEFVYKKIIKHWSKGKLQVNRVHLRNGQHFDVSEDHPMWVRDSQKISRYNKQVLSEVDLTRWWKRKIPIAKKIPYKIQDIDYLNEDKCIILGHFLADGWHDKNGKVGSSGYELYEHIIPLLEKNNIPFSENKNNSGVPIINFLNSELKEFLKLQKSNSFDIHLEEKIFHLSKNKLEKLLYGLWLGDGTKSQYPDKRGFKNNKEWTYSTSSKQLAEDIQRIGLQIGRTFHIWKQDNHKGIGNKPIYRINYNPKSHFLKNYGYSDVSEVSISYIEKLGAVDMYDLTVQDTHTVIMKNGIITHQCEDGAILMANMMINSGVSSWRLRLNAGDVKIGNGVRRGGHAYVTYLREFDNKWYVLDWCYEYKESVNFKKTWKKAKKYFSIWFSWNLKYIYKNIELDR